MSKTLKLSINLTSCEDWKVFLKDTMQNENWHAVSAASTGTYSIIDGSLGTSEQVSVFDEGELGVRMCTNYKNVVKHLGHQKEIQ